MVSLGHSHNILQGLGLKQVVNYANISALWRICGNVMIVTSDSKFLCVGTKFLHFGSHISNISIISLKLLNLLQSMAKGNRLRQTINKRGTKILRAMELLFPTHTYLKWTGYDFMLKFTDRASGDVYTDGRKRLNQKNQELGFPLTIRRWRRSCL